MEGKRERKKKGGGGGGGRSGQINKKSDKTKRERQMQKDSRHKRETHVKKENGREKMRNIHRWIDL